MMTITVRLRPEEAERVLTAMESGESDDPVDGLMEMAEAQLRGDATGRTPVDISLHIDAQTLEAVGVENSIGVPAETSRRLLCDAGIASVLGDGEGRVIDVGRKMRTVSAALNRALRAGGENCQFPGCSNCRFVEAHHIKHWINGGETVLANLVRLCSRHHKMVHEYGFGVSHNEAGELVFTDPRGRVVSAETPLCSWSPQLIDEAIKARATQQVPGWDGLPVQWERCVDALVSASP